MGFQEIMDAAQSVWGLVFGVLAGLGGMLTWFLTVRRQLTQPLTDRIDQVAGSLDELGGRVEALERTVQHLPTREQFEQMRLSLVEQGREIVEVRTLVHESRARDRDILDRLAAVATQVNVILEAELRREKKS